MAVSLIVIALMLCAAGAYSLWRASKRPRRPDAGCSELVLRALGGIVLIALGLALLLYLLL